MKRLIAFTALLVLVGVASAPAVFYHPMITFEHCAQNFTPKALIANGHFVFYMSEAVEGARNKAILFPLDVGFAFDERWSASFVLPLVKTMPVDDPITPDVEKGKFGLADPWLKGKFIPMLGPNISVGPRIAFRLPVGTEGIAIKHMAVDFAGLFHMGYTTAFKLDAQIGMTMELAKDNVKSPSPFYFVAEPGYAFNPKMSFCGIIGVAIPVLKGEDALGAEVDGVKEYWVGEKFNWKLSPNVTINEVFSYRLGEEAAGKDLYFGAGVTATIPF